MRKSKRKKEKVKIHCPGILPTPFVPPQSEKKIRWEIKS